MQQANLRFLRFMVLQVGAPVLPFLSRAAQKSRASCRSVVLRCASRSVLCWPFRERLLSAQPASALLRPAAHLRRAMRARMRWTGWP